MTTPILAPGQLEQAPGAIPEIILPPADLFGRRSHRLRTLAENHPLAPYLKLFSACSQVQQEALDGHDAIATPDEQFISQCLQHGMPPLAPGGWKRDASWQESLTKIIATALLLLPKQGAEELAQLPLQDKAWLEQQADILVQGFLQQQDQERIEEQLSQLNLALAPFIGAALQIQWTWLARHCSLAPSEFQQKEICPICGCPPVASIISNGDDTRGLRYQHCSLCNTRWHVVRALCSQCGNMQNLEYFSLEENAQVVRAESCPQCHSYIKIIAETKKLREQVDAVADDIATIALDLLMGEKEYGKNSLNLLLLFGLEE